MDSLKSNSHIIPRWVFREIKAPNGGQYFIRKNGHFVRSQSEKSDGLVKDIVCEKCEYNFKCDDDFAVVFFRESKFDLDHLNLGIESTLGRVGYIEFNSDCFIKLRKFILGMLCRFELRENCFKRSLLGPLKDQLFDSYNNPSVEISRFPIFMEKYYDLDKAASEVHQYRWKGLRVSSFIYLDYRFVVFCDSRHISPIEYKEFIISQSAVRAFKCEAKTGYPKPIFNIKNNKKKGF